MTPIDLLRSVAAMGLVVAAGAQLEARARGEVAVTSKVGAILNGAALHATRLVSVSRRDVRLKLTPNVNQVNASTTDPAPLGAVRLDGFGGVVESGAVNIGLIGPNVPIASDRTGVPIVSLAQAKRPVGIASTMPTTGIAPTMPTTGIGPVVPSPLAPNPFAGYPTQSLNATLFGADLYGLGGFGALGGGGFGGLGIGGFGYPGMYGGFGGTYGGSGLSLPPLPEASFGAYHAGNVFSGPADGTGVGAGVPADPNAQPAGNAGPNAIGGPSEDPFDAAAAGHQLPSRQIRSKRARTARRPTVRKPAAQPFKKPEAKVPDAEAIRPQVNRVRDEAPVTPQMKPAAAAKVEAVKPVPARKRSILGSP